MTEPTAVFVPSGRRGHVPAGTTVLDAARRFGVDLDSVCGGRGICGRCQVRPAFGEFAKHALTSAPDHLSPPGVDRARVPRPPALGGRQPPGLCGPDPRRRGARRPAGEPGPPAGGAQVGRSRGAGRRPGRPTALRRGGRRPTSVKDAAICGSCSTRSTSSGRSPTSAVGHRRAGRPAAGPGRRPARRHGRGPRRQLGHRGLARLRRPRPTASPSTSARRPSPATSASSAAARCWRRPGP